MQKPSIGRIVRYNTDTCQLGAFVCDVHSDTCVNLAVFAKDGTSHGVLSATLDDAGRPGSWSWPAFEQPAPRGFMATAEDALGTPVDTNNADNAGSQP